MVTAQPPANRPTPRPAKRFGAQTTLFIVAVALALLVAQALGLLHGIVHSPVQANSTAYSTAYSTALAHAPSVRGPALRTVTPSYTRSHGASTGDVRRKAAAAPDFLALLFSGHLDKSDCRSYDQLSHFDAVPGVAALALPLVLTPFLLSTLTGLATARWHALFQARGPPSLR